GGRRSDADQGAGLGRCEDKPAKSRRGSSPAPGPGQADPADPGTPQPQAARRERTRRRKARARAAKLGRSRGGLTSKIHYACDGKARPFPAIVTAGQDGDCPQFIPGLERITVKRARGGKPRSRPTAVAADMAYGSRENRNHLRKRKIKAV